MDKMSVLSVLFVSFPEELLVVIATLLAAGYRDVLDIRKLPNLLKLVGTAAAMVLVSVVIRAVVPALSYIALIQTVLFYLIIIGVYRYRIVTCLLGFLLSLFVLIVMETSVVPFLLGLYHLSLNEFYQNWVLRFIMTLPTRIVQIILVVILMRVRKINLRMYKASTDIWMLSILYFLTLANTLFLVDLVFWDNIAFNVKIVSSLIFSIGVIIIFSVWFISNLNRLKRDGRILSNINNVSLNHIKQLLEENKVDYAIELIELTLRDSGYYDREEISDTHIKGEESGKGGML